MGDLKFQLIKKEIFFQIKQNYKPESREGKFEEGAVELSGSRDTPCEEGAVAPISSEASKMSTPCQNK
jgi:hypothetical protein